MASFVPPPAPRMGTISLPTITSPDWSATAHGHTHVDTSPLPNQSLWLNSPPAIDEATEHNALALFFELPSVVSLPSPAQTSPPALEVGTAQQSASHVDTLQPVSSTSSTSHGRRFHGEHPFFLEHLNNHTGDAQASSLHERDTVEDSPIDTAVQMIQEAGLYTKTTAFWTARTLLADIEQGEKGKKEVHRDIFFLLVNVFKRYPYTNLAAASLVFYLVVALSQINIMQSHDLIHAADELFKEGNHGGCRLILRLIFDNPGIDLTDSDIGMLADLALYL